MTTMNVGYASAYSAPVAATSTPANFGPGQLKSDNQEAEISQNQAKDSRDSEKRANPGYTTETRGSQLNITI